VTGIEMVRGHPVELRAEIRFHLPHQVADKGFEIGKATPGRVGPLSRLHVLLEPTPRPGIVPRIVRREEAHEDGICWLQDIRSTW
jgi:hypothetical protein